MRRKLVWFVWSAAIMVTALFHARPAMATPPNGFTSTTIRWCKVPTIRQRWFRWHAMVRGHRKEIVITNLCF